MLFNKTLHNIRTNTLAIFKEFFFFNNFLAMEKFDPTARLEDNYYTFFDFFH
jgi:hypothetical protein